MISTLMQNDSLFILYAPFLQDLYKRGVYLKDKEIFAFFCFLEAGIMIII